MGSFSYLLNRCHIVIASPALRYGKNLKIIEKKLYTLSIEKIAVRTIILDNSGKM